MSSPPLDSLISLNPATQIPIWEGRASTSTDIDTLINSASKAQQLWATKTREDRSKVLLAIKEKLQDNLTSLATLISQESGKTLWECKGEVAAMIGKIDITFGAYEERCHKMVNSAGKALAITRPKPLGVLAVIGPFNFPMHLPHGHMIPALLAGNAVILKPSELTPACGEKLIQLYEEAGLPAGLAAVVQGGVEPSKALVNHPQINGVLFTGSAKAGYAIAQALAKTPHKLLALEMGGNNPLVVESYEDITAAAFTIVQSAFSTTGQRCTCTRRLIMIEGEKTKGLLDKVLSLTQSLKIGPPSSEPEPFMGPLISNQSATSMMAFQDKIKSLSGTCLLVATRPDETLPFVTPGIWDVTGVEGIPDEECFGPLLLVTRVKSFEEAVAQSNNTSYGLAAGILCVDEALHLDYFRQVKAGIINWNTPTTGASSRSPFGGVGKSGNYRPAAFYAADYCAYPVASMEAKTLLLPEVLPPGISLDEGR